MNFEMYGAEGETRTPTSLRPLDPEPSASTNSATSANEVAGTLSNRPVSVKALDGFDEESQPG